MQRSNKGKRHAQPSSLHRHSTRPALLQQQHAPLQMTATQSTQQRSSSCSCS
jgi:hypothetical protein